jgi:hypothetical protein
MQTATTTAQTIIEQIKVLPPESLDDLASYVEFLRFKAGGGKAPTASPEKLRVVNLRGLLEGYDFSPELLAEARREMWQSLEETETP